MTAPVMTREERAALAQYEDVPRLKSVTTEELLTHPFRQRDFICKPFLPHQGIVEIYSARGVAKTWVSVGLGLSIAAGVNFLRWEISKPAKVLLVDGEMPGNAMQERVASVISGINGDVDPRNFRIITPDLQDLGIPSLSSPYGQAAIEAELEDAELLILDNLSTLCRGGKENEGESWLPVQEWLLSLRRRGVSTLFMHHAGKGGAQRGTSRKEDILDTVIALRHPCDYSPEEGARFEVHFEKARGTHGDAVAPFEVRMHTEAGACVWETLDLKNVVEARVRALLQEQMTIRDIEAETGVKRSTIHRLKKKMEAGL